MYLQDTVGTLKNGLCSHFKVDPDAVELWDYWNNRKFASLEDRLYEDLGQAQIQDGQSLLLEAKVKGMAIASGTCST